MPRSVGHVRSRAAWVAVLASATWTTSALAQPPADKPPDAPPVVEVPTPEPPQTPAARADAMFQKGKRLLEEGQVEAACKQLAESDALDPTVGTLGLLAACHEQKGRVATAWGEFRETARRADAAKDERASFARQHAAALESRLPKLSIRLAHPGDGGPSISRNRVPVPSSQLGLEVAVDPGSYEIVARGANGAEHRTTVIAREGASVTVDVPDLGPASPAPEPSYPQRIGVRWPAGFVAIGIGLVGVGVGAAAGVAAMNQNLESKQSFDTCKAPGAAPNACDAGREARDSAFRSATISTIGFAAGVTGIAVGVALHVWPPPRAPRSTARAFSVTPVVGSSGGAALAQGVF